jgi:hypothetical protein
MKALFAYSARSKDRLFYPQTRTVNSRISIRSLFASCVYFFCVKAQPLCLRRTQGANDHIKQGHTGLFAGNTVGATYNQLAAMLTGLIHICLSRRKEHAISNSFDDAQ